jgi:hypothetical protein
MDRKPPNGPDARSGVRQDRGRGSPPQSSRAGHRRDRLRRNLQTAVDVQLKNRLRRWAPAARESHHFIGADEIGYLPVTPGGGNLFFQLVNARYEKGAMILTSNRGFAEWGELFGDSVVAIALLDRLLHDAVVIQIEGSSYRLREHADLVPETIHHKTQATANPIPPTLKRRGRSPKNGGADHVDG